MDETSLINMANQIADFFQPYTEAESIDGITTHIQSFWEPRMRAGLSAALDANPDAFHPHVVAAVKRLAAAAQS
jgi:formate dehydrogenase subunit delta